MDYIYLIYLTSKGGVANLMVGSTILLRRMVFFVYLNSEEPFEQ